MKQSNKFYLYSLILTLILALSGCGQASLLTAPINQSQTESLRITSIQTVHPTPAVTITTSHIVLPSPTATDMNVAGRFTTPKDVAAYLNVYHQLPSNFITKPWLMHKVMLSERERGHYRH